MGFYLSAPNWRISGLDMGHQSVKVSAVPLPATAWLFISAIAGFAGAKRLSQIAGIVPSNGQASISVSVADDGGASITSYTAYCFGDALSFDTSPTLPITVSGLTNGEAYECLVTATNDVGTSPLSGISAPVTPVAPAPGC
jgi:hypothetical protein